MMIDKLPPITQAYRLLLQEQKHKDLTILNNQNIELMALAADNRFNSPHKFQHGGDSGNNSGNKRGYHYYCTHYKVPRL